MYTVRNSIQRPNWIAALLIVSLGMLACNVLTLFNKSETASTPQSETVETQSTSGPSDGQAEIPEMGGVKITYDGDFNGIKYQLDYPAAFIHSTSGGWQEFCLEGSEKLCVSIQPQNGNWNDTEAMADEIITGFSSAVGNYQELDRQNTYSGDGFPAFLVTYTYSWQGKDLEGSRLFILIQHIGFDIAAEGDSVMMDKYRSVINSIVDSFRLDYN
jgi:hypothetical protein